ncbi:MAG: putative zinc-binding peptidase [Thauera sp.]|nr:putative zinc-binding peptidase [Thauera sp.]
MKTFDCANCGFVAFFENTVCGNCGAWLGFVPEELAMAAFEARPDGLWRRLGVDPTRIDALGWRPCLHYVDHQVCNWMIRADDEHDLCRSCRHTDVIPDVGDLQGKAAWFGLEAAKRRLFYSLYQLGLPVHGDKGPPLMFHFRGGQGEEVTTGHLRGTITLDIAEAVDSTRESRRMELGEPYRTLLGHFRHEIGHYYWERLIGGGRWLPEFRRLFGDERANYADAVAAHYTRGAPPDWFERHISAYAAMHPWEDWAETWAHYLHITDALDTATHWGFALHPDCGGLAVQAPAAGHGERPFRQVLLERWLPLAQFLNSMGRSLGQGDAYPFVIANAVLDKLCFVHEVVRAVRAPAPEMAAQGDGGGLR